MIKIYYSGFNIEDLGDRIIQEVFNRKMEAFNKALSIESLNSTSKVVVTKTNDSVQYEFIDIPEDVLYRLKQAICSE